MSWLWWRSPPCRRQRVIVNRKHDPNTAIGGVFWSMQGDWVTLRACALLKTGEPSTPIDGDVILHRDVIDFVQVVAT